MAASLHLVRTGAAPEESEYGSEAEWRKEVGREAKDAPEPRPFPVCDRLAIPVRGLALALVFSGILWTILILAGREVWRLLR